MTKRSAYRFMLLLLCLLGWQTAAGAAGRTPMEDGGLPTAFVDSPDERPQWQDVGLCDVLAVTGGSTLIPPTTVRVVHDHPSGGTPAAMQPAGTRHGGLPGQPSYSHCHTVSGYIYLIRCLRL